MGKDEKKAAVALTATKMAVTGALATVSPELAIVAATLSPLLDKAVDSTVALVQQQALKPASEKLKRALGIALTTMNEGNPEIGYVQMQAYADKSDFRDRLFTTARAFQEATPCDEVIPAIGILFASYDGKKPDQEYRHWLAFLCDLDGSEIEPLVELAERIRVMPVDAVEVTLVEPTVGQKQVAAGQEPPTVVLKVGNVITSGPVGAALDPNICINATGVLQVLDLLVVHQLVWHDALSARKPGQLTNVGRFRITSSWSRFACRLFGIV